jgi:hypothetical protein
MFNPERLLSRLVFANDEVEILIRRNRATRVQVIAAGPTGVGRIAAAVSIQSAFRGWNTRRKYLAVKYPNLTNLTTLQTLHNVRAKTKPLTLKELEIQESLIQKYRQYCLIYDRVYKKEEVVDFPQFAAVFIQAQWRCSKARKLFRVFLGLKLQERSARVQNQV